MTVLKWIFSVFDTKEVNPIIRNPFAKSWALSARFISEQNKAPLNFHKEQPFLVASEDLYTYKEVFIAQLVLSSVVVYPILGRM